LANARVLRWHGGKGKLAPKIVPLLPKHHSYVELFGGGGAVLLEKDPSEFEVYNDINGDLVNFFRVLRARPEELIRLVELTLYSRDEYKDAGEPTQDPLERARRFITCSWMTVSGYQGQFRSETDWRRLCHYNPGEHNPPSVEWQRLGARLWACVQRLRLVQVENRPALDVLKSYDGPGVLFYADPPYVASTRSGPKKYSSEMSEQDHANLVEKLLDAQGAVVLSGYRSELYDNLLKGVERHDFAVTLHSTRAGKGQHRGQRLECLWIKREGVARAGAQRSLLEVVA